MAKTNYHISLKGYVGGSDFNREDVDSVLNTNDGKRVDVLIDSLGGSLATGLSISAAFRNHGEIYAHFVGLNASAATVASLGAKHISMDAGAMYLVHKCSTAFIEWGYLNSDQFSTLIADCEKIKADLDKLDLNIANLYAKKCRKPVEDLLALMKVGGWLTAKEALEWGFVDEITDVEDESAPVLTDAVASAMANAGIPIPNIKISDAEKNSFFGKLIEAVSSFFGSGSNAIVNSIKSMKTYTFLSAILAEKPITVNNGMANVSVDQLDAIEAALKDKDDIIADKDATIADLRAKLEKQPATGSKQVVENSKSEDNKDNVSSDVEAFSKTLNAARNLFNEV